MKHFFRLDKKISNEKLFELLLVCTHHQLGVQIVAAWCESDLRVPAKHKSTASVTPLKLSAVK